MKEIYLRGGVTLKDWTQTLGPGAAMNVQESVVRTFALTDVPIDSEQARVEGDAWVVGPPEQSWFGKLLHRGQSVELFSVSVEERGVLLVYRAKVRPEGLKGRAYLEMHCRINDREFFSKGYAFGEAEEGSEDWRTIETPFMVRAGENLDRVRLNLAVEGEGRVWIKDVELMAAPLAAS